MLNSHANVVYTVAYSPKGDLLATGGDDKLIKYWSAADMAGSCVRARVTARQSQYFQVQGFPIRGHNS
jgi:WD40 repeat protein